MVMFWLVWLMHAMLSCVRANKLLFKHGDCPKKLMKSSRSWCGFHFSFALFFFLVFMFSSNCFRHCVTHMLQPKKIAFNSEVNYYQNLGYETVHEALDEFLNGWNLHAEHGRIVMPLKKIKNKNSIWFVNSVWTKRKYSTVPYERSVLSMSKLFSDAV